MSSQSPPKPAQGRATIDEKSTVGAQGVPRVSQEVSGVPADRKKHPKSQNKRPRGVAAPAAKFAVVAPLNTPEDVALATASFVPYLYNSLYIRGIVSVAVLGYTYTSYQLGEYLGNSFISSKEHGLAYPLPFSYLTLLHESPPRSG